MKNFGHIWEWGKNPEYTIDICTHWGRWALPLAIDHGSGNRHFFFAIQFLCFSFFIEIWRE